MEDILDLLKLGLSVSFDMLSSHDQKIFAQLQI